MAYPHAVDAGRSDEVGALFGDEGMLVVHGGRECRGAGNVVAFLEQSRASRSGAQPLRLRHHVSSQHVSLESGGAARATSYFVAMGPTGPDHWGVYRDRLVRTGGVWLFAERRVTIEGADPGGWVGSGAAPVPFTRA